MTLEVYTATGRRTIGHDDAEYSRVLIDIGSRVRYSNEIGTVITYSGRKPEYFDLHSRSSRRCAYCASHALGDQCERCGAPT